MAIEGSKELIEYVGQGFSLAKFCLADLLKENEGKEL
jgi:hypothetical protein